MTIWRRFAAALYDSFILISFLMLATFVALLFHDGASFGPNHLGFLSYLICVSFLFYGWCWTHGGQTLGMLAWKIKVVRHDGEPLTWRDAFRRFCFALLNLVFLGSGWLWCFFDRDRQSLHDKLSKTYLVMK